MAATSGGARRAMSWGEASGAGEGAGGAAGGGPRSLRYGDGWVGWVDEWVGWLLALVVV